MRKILITIMSVLGLGLFTQSIQAQSNSITANSKTTATLAAVCTISSQNINFGQISLPIGSQSASSNMVVQCTKGSPYTIGLAYGGIYGSGQSADYYVPTGGSVIVGNCGSVAVFTHYSSTNANLGTVTAVTNSQTCTMLNLTQSGSVYRVGATYAYGKMIGSLSGDSIGYSIQVPNQPSQIWNTGNNSYSSTATGANQTIPVVATLNPSQTTNTYPTADNYVDVVTATITY